MSDAPNGRTPDAVSRLQSLDHRIRNVAQASAQDVQRVRRQLAFHRLLARVADAGWVLKGGYCLEARLAGQARATRDIDFVRAGQQGGDELLDELDDLFQRAQIDDGFTFEALTAKLMRSADDPAPAWRVQVLCRTGEREFERLGLDIVSQYAEVAESLDTLVIAPPVALTGCEPVAVQAVDVYQHAAEKYHAMSRLYANERPSTRVKDLVDIALLIEAGLLADPARLRQRLVVVHRERDDAVPPTDLPEPPRDWAPAYARLVTDLDLSLDTVDAAFERARAVYRDAMSEMP